MLKVDTWPFAPLPPVIVERMSSAALFTAAKPERLRREAEYERQNQYS
jgi:hypothetical protein